MIFVNRRLEASGGDPVRPTGVEGRVGRKVGQAGGVDGEDGGEEVQAEAVDEEPENGHRSVIKKHQTWMPTSAEREEHAMTHLPFRRWCEHCVKGRGEDMKHLKVKEEPEQLQGRGGWRTTGPGEMPGRRHQRQRSHRDGRDERVEAQTRGARIARCC